MDSEGYPRADIDIWSIAEVRKKVVMLQNDHVGMMKQIEQLLMAAFSSSAANDIDEAESKQSDGVQHGTESKQKSITDQIVSESEKNDIISNMKAFISNAQNEEETVSPKEEDMDAMEPFYIIDSIFDHSPSHSAGLRSGDLIIKFGSMTAANQSPQLMQDIVRQSVNKEIAVIIKRNPEGYCTLKLVPQQWDGKGLLGCHLKPYSK